MSDDGPWAQMPLPHGSGWVERRVLAPQAADAGVVPDDLPCLGTQPERTLSLTSGAAAFLILFEGGDPRGLEPRGSIMGAAGVVAIFGDGAAACNAAIAPAACLDALVRNFHRAT